jgi:ankyrin repeat protein
MGASLFCSYYIENQITQLRRAIAESKLNEMCQKLKSKDKVYDQEQEIEYNSVKKSKISELVDSEIDLFGNTALLYSIEMKQLNSFKFLLLELNADPNKPNYYSGHTPLHVLAQCKVQQPSDQRDSKKSKVTFVSASVSSSIGGSEPISLSPNKLAFRLDNLSSASKGEANLSSSSSSGNSDSDLAQKPMNLNDFMEMVDLLIDKKASINMPVKVNKNQLGRFDIKFATPLLFAIFNQNKVMVNRLIKAGCDTNYQDSYSKISALQMACYMGSIDIIAILLDNNKSKVDLYSKSKEGSNCLHWLAISEKDDIGILRLIMNHLTKEFETKYVNETKLPTSEPDFYNKLDAYLKDFIDQTNDNKQTPLMLAANLNKQNLVKSLLDYEAGIDLKDINDLTAINYSNQNSCMELIKSYNKVKKITLKKSSTYFKYRRADDGPMESSVRSQPSVDLSTKYKNSNNDPNDLVIKSIS